MAKEYEFYEHFNNRKPMVQEEYEDAYSKSVASEGIAKPTSKSNMKWNQVKLRLAAIGLVVVMAVSAWAGIGMSNVIENNQEQRIVAEYFDDMGINNVLGDASWGSYDSNGKRIFGYNQSTLSNYVESSENQDIALFGLYQSINTNRTSNMNEIISRVTFNDGIKCDTQDEYLVARGFVDKDGKPSTEVYEEKMTERVLAEKTIKETNTNHGIK